MVQKQEKANYAVLRGQSNHKNGHPIEGMMTARGQTVLFRYPGTYIPDIVANNSLGEYIYIY